MNQRRPVRIRTHGDPLRELLREVEDGQRVLRLDGVLLVLLDLVAVLLLLVLLGAEVLDGLDVRQRVRRDVVVLVVVLVRLLADRLAPHRQLERQNGVPATNERHQTTLAGTTLNAT